MCMEMHGHGIHTWYMANSMHFRNHTSECTVEGPLWACFATTYTHCLYYQHRLIYIDNEQWYRLTNHIHSVLRDEYQWISFELPYIRLIVIRALKAISCSTRYYLHTCEPLIYHISKSTTYNEDGVAFYFSLPNCCYLLLLPLSSLWTGDTYRRSC